ncbi:hypothetical protein E2C01_084660 [Portunus trituberculatus]|uniref:Uncharacterized protein n=1 Tax=Portunus trituberculatus TaxID=210409 RepID=A0A5B7J5F0_PORTR|nr:hypothetical protein [Portunus trituberculatus]
MACQIITHDHFGLTFVTADRCVLPRPAPPVLLLSRLVPQRPPPGPSRIPLQLLRHAPLCSVPALQLPLIFSYPSLPSRFVPNLLFAPPHITPRLSCHPPFSHPLPIPSRPGRFDKD